MEQPYAFFDQTTDPDNQDLPGVVLNVDMSDVVDLPERALTQDEINVYADWETKHALIKAHYTAPGNAIPAPTTKEELMMHRLLPPLLNQDGGQPSTRSAANERRAGRVYPPQANMFVWDDFRAEVEAYSPGESLLEDTVGNPFMHCLDMNRDGEYRRCHPQSRHW